jgi:hypothetical protein
MAGATPLVRVPIDLTQPEGGYVEFRGDITAPAGIYSFSYYFRKAAIGPKAYNGKNIDVHEHPWAIYIRGLDLYTQLVKSGAPSEGLKVVIYTDQQTLDDIDECMPSLAKELIQEVFADPAVILAKVVWPEYAPFPADAAVSNKEKKVDNAILRTFRMFSFAVFNCPVFVRDADTTFDIAYGPTEKTLEIIRVWETTFFEQARAKGFPMIYASQTGYIRKFHVNYRIEGESAQSLGTFAGLVNSLGGLQAEMRELWQEALAYIRGTCRIVPETGISSNQANPPQYISKDEQILVFVFLPPLMDRTFFFYYNFVPNGYFTSWADTNSGFGRAFHRFIEEFPGQFEKKISYSGWGGAGNYWAMRNPKFFWTPKEKLGDFLSKVHGKHAFSLEAVGTPPAGEASPVPKDTEELAREWMEEWIGKGLTDPADPILDPRWVAEDRGDTLHNPYSVVEAFRNPKYDTLLRITFEEIQRAHRKVCITKGIHGRYALAAKYNEANRVNREREEAAAAEKAIKNAKMAEAMAAYQARAKEAPAPLGLGLSFGAARPLPLGLGLGLGLAAKPGEGGGRKKTQRRKLKRSKKTRRQKS